MIITVTVTVTVIVIIILITVNIIISPVAISTLNMSSPGLLQGVSKCAICPGEAKPASPATKHYMG